MRKIILILFLCSSLWADVEWSTDPNRVRVIPFEYSNTDTYIIKLSDEYITFYRDGGQILDDSNDPYYIDSNFTTEQLRGIQYVQLNDIMYMVHPDLCPKKLSRTDHDDWTIEDVNWEWGPFLDENTEDVNITPDGTTGSITLVADSDIFTSSHVGALWRITNKADNSYLSGTLDANESSDELSVYGEFLLSLDGAWDGLVKLEKSSDGGMSWDTVYPKLGPADYHYINVDFSGNEDESGYSYRVTMIDFYSGYCFYTLTSYNDYIDSYVKITSFTGANEVDATVMSDLASTNSTMKWAEGAWSDERGWPKAVCTYQNRLVLAGTDYIPNGLWVSKAGGDYENMKETTLDDGAIVYEVGSAKQNPILWLQDKNGIIAGTAGSIIRIFSQSTASALTAATIGSEVQNENGSCNIQAQLVDDSLIYVDRNRRVVRDLIYDLQSDGYVSPELTVFAEHITDPCVVEMYWQKRPENIGWFILGDGNAVTLTYNKEQGVVAWAKQITDGSFESVASIPGDDEDEVWFSIKRTIDSTDYRYIEQLQSQDWGSDNNDVWFVDSGLAYDGESTDTITGLEHLEDEEVLVYGSNGYYQSATVSSGEISLDTEVTTANVGLGYTSYIKTFPIEIQGQGGASVGLKKNIREITLCLYKSIGGQYGIDDDYYSIPYPTSDEIYNGVTRMAFETGYDEEPYIQLKQEYPYPFGLSAISLTKFEISDDR